MSCLNKVMLIGNLGGDPEMRSTSSGSLVCRLRLATSERGSQEKEKEALTEWHTVIAFGRLAEISRDYLRKGRSIYVEGSLHTRTVPKKEEGPPLRFTEVWAKEIRFLPSGGHRGEGQNQINGDEVLPSG